MPCRKHCCFRTFVPLALSHARTIHSFQGETAGPDEPGKPPNNIKKIIIDPGDKSFELINPSLFYVAFSRGTTLGDSSRMNSAIYFCGEHITEARLINMTKTKQNIESIYVQRRNKWIKILKQNTHESNLSIKQLMTWCKSFQSTQASLYKFIVNGTHIESTLTFNHEFVTVTSQ